MISVLVGSSPPLAAEVTSLVTVVMPRTPKPVPAMTRTATVATTPATTGNQNM